MSEDLAVSELADAIAERIAKMFDENPPAPAPWLDSEAAGRFVGADGGYMTHLRNVGRGPRFHMSSQKFVRYSLQDLREWMDAYYENPADRGSKA